MSSSNSIELNDCNTGLYSIAALLFERRNVDIEDDMTLTGGLNETERLTHSNTADTQ
jgi:hypothetical protein